ncbi:MAG: tyrosinase family protein, partial [Acidobacteriota bacterium]
ARLYPDGGAQGDLAQETWSTCQAHNPNDDENFFLPWHRMYVYFFETIIREVSGEPTFTLPYWNYSTSDLAIRGVLPEEFRQQGSSLFVDKRNPGVNDGRPIQGDDQSLLSLDSLEQCTYKPQGTQQGFNMKLDFILHGNIHVRVGNRMNMGAVPWAAGDPIFWMHHCNIDRIWASWNAAGRQNPVDDPNWMDRAFTFADAAGTRVETQVRDVNDIASLGYEYDQLEPAAGCETGDELGLASATPEVVRGSARERVSLAGAAATRVTLAPESELSVASALGDDQKLFVKISGLEAQAQPDVVYLIYYGLPDGVEGEARDAYLLGSVNFFGAVPHDHGGDHEAQAASADLTERFFSFDATSVHRRLVAEQSAGADPQLTIVPLGEPAENAQPVLGAVQLIEQ